jgi:beta-glucanase (GH16 family)
MNTFSSLAPVVLFQRVGRLLSIRQSIGCSAAMPTAVAIAALVYTLVISPANAAPVPSPNVKSSTRVASTDPTSKNNSSQAAAAADFIPMPNALYGKGYKLAKNWDFGQTIKTDEQLRAEFFTRYVYDGGKLDTLPGNKEWERYRDNDNHRLEGSSLKLTAHVRGGLVDGGIESGMLRSRWTGKYGYYECRLKVPAGRGLWPAFWLNPHDEKWPPEIDILEIVDNGRDSTKNSFHFVHTGKADTATTLSTKLDQWNSYRPGFDYKDDFHTFAVEWTPDTVTHYVDEIEVVSRRFGWKHDDGSDGGAADVLLNLAVGGTWPGPPLNVNDFPAILEVDYIRVWQK